MTNSGFSGGFDMSNLYETTQEEIEKHLAWTWRERGPLYEMQANALMADYNPTFAKMHRWGSTIFQTLPNGDPPPEPEAYTVPNSIQQLHSYMMLGWETGIRNQFRVLKIRGFTKAQIMEIVHFARLSAGMRGLGHVYRAVGDMLPDYQDGHGHPPFPSGWAADPQAFKSGLDLTTRNLTDADRTNVTAWYERTIGYLPNSVQWGMKFDPQFLKIHRAMWETAIVTLPKQVVPYMMIRDSMIATDRDAIREAVALSKAWGIIDDLIVRAVTQTAHYFTGMRGLYAVHDATQDLL
jgi:hypothetical protein